MQTSNFANNNLYFGKGNSIELVGISISRYPRNFNGPEFTPLMPCAQLLKGYKEDRIDWTEYTRQYQTQLQCLDASRVHRQLVVIAKEACGDEMFGTHEPVLLCHESALTLKNKPCHRRLVADWFEAELGIVVPEWRKVG